MKTGKYRWSKSVNDFKSLNLNVIDHFISGKRMKLSQTSYHDTNEDTAPEDNTPKKKSDKENADFYPNVDTSIWTRSCEQEVIEPLQGKITGTIPSWLRGTLLRNGPGSLKVGEYRFDHLFDSSALLHRFGIADGKVTYQRKFVRTEVYKKNHAAQRIVVTEFGTRAVPDPCKTIFQRIAATFNPGDSVSDNSMISVYPFGDEYYTFTEYPIIHRIDPKTLETTGRVNVAEHVAIVSHTSHPHVMNDGTVYNVGMSISKKGPVYSVIRFSPLRDDIDESGQEKKQSMFDQATIVATVPSRWILNPSYMHSFGITENYFIIVEQPLSVSLIGMMSAQVRHKAMISALKWHDNENTLIHVISRKTGEVERVFIAETFFYLHIINQFETRDGEYIVLDICCYRDAQMLNCLYIDMIQNVQKNPDYAKLFRGRPLRFVLPMKEPATTVPFDQNLITINNGIEDSEISLADKCEPNEKISNKNYNENVYDKNPSALRRRAAAHRLQDGSILVKPELLCDLGCETPRINWDSCLGREYRYFYAISSDIDIEHPGMLIKVDTVTKTKKTWYEAGAYPSEPIFVPDPDGKKEDDGVVLSALVWSNGHESEVGLLILDGTDLKEIGRATFDTPGPVPKCLHGWFSMDRGK